MKYKYLLTMASIVLLLGSCGKKLDLRPTDIIVESTAFQTVTDLNQGLLGAYSALNAENIIYTNTLMADESRLSAQNTGQGQGAFKWQHDASTLGADLTANWVNSYRAIDRANKVLAAIPRVIANTPSEVARKEVIRGELLTIRALAHFDLVRMYSRGYNPSDVAVPLVNDVVLPDRATYPARSTVSEVLTSLKADLVTAKSLLPASQPDIYSISRLTVSATQARIALYEKDWDNAIGFSTEVINALPLAEASAYPSIFRDAVNTEVVFKLRRNVSTTRPGELWQRASNGDVFFAVSNKLLSSINAATDVRYGVLVKIDNTKPEPQLVNKYPGASGQIGIQDIKYYRTSEMYLIRAEANAEKNTPASIALGLADLNTLRSKRISAYTPLVITTSAALVDAVLAERFVELAYEGHRFFDLKRKNLPVSRIASDLNNAPEAITLLPTNFRYTLPLPQSETFANTNLVNNPLY
ncbi:RagB/SusD family nutrient uptake outer membrane protein [Pedobacter sp. SL55]|uniref:RagB/SusD family nutrient uptake outer membrane protein n=1 Tax=Pedobacter sp. SL55 TaxID=2995161 RepID=UPI00226E5AE4|nr:RagB/SusD family nutrient uptake outer membrane protein [Pedobacter sp. SL55]WAC41885.1 RagB/SusD family nutrient uptake outer membrane protein [Pedobacter sp. SL55]